MAGVSAGQQLAEAEDSTLIERVQLSATAAYADLVSTG
jgi:hypothetical protein